MCIKTSGNVTAILYDASDEIAERDYPIAYLKELNGVLIIIVLPIDPTNRLEFYNLGVMD